MSQEFESKRGKGRVNGSELPKLIAVVIRTGMGSGREIDDDAEDLSW
jgi:hypothetical protein